MEGLRRKFGRVCGLAGMGLAGAMLTLTGGCYGRFPRTGGVTGVKT